MREFSNPKIYVYRDSRGRPDTSKPWHIYYSVSNDLGEWEPFKKRSGINYIKDARQRMISAKALQKAVLKELRRGWRPESNKAVAEAPSEVTLVNLFYEYFEASKLRVKRRTWQSYKYAIDKFAGWMKKTNRAWKRPQDFTRKDAFAYGDYLDTIGWNAKTINNHRGDLGKFFIMLSEREPELMPSNPLKVIKKRQEVEGRNLAFTPEQWHKIMDDLQEHDPLLRKFCRHIFFLFIRPIELLRIKKSDIDFTDALNIKMHVYGDDAKTSRHRTLEIANSWQLEFLSYNYQNLNDDDYIFGFQLNSVARKYNRGSVSDRFKECKKRIGGFKKEHTMYACKHTGNVAAYKSGVSIYDICKQNGHATIQETENYLRSMGQETNSGFKQGMKELKWEK